MAKRRRIIFKVLVFVLAGAIINVAVAWGCAVQMPPQTVIAEQYVDLSQEERTFSLCCASGDHGIRYNRILLDRISAWRKVFDRDRTTFQWDIDGRGVCYEYNVIVNMRGFPLVSLAYIDLFETSRDYAPEICGWDDIGGWDAAHVDSAWNVRGLPLYPLWPGFAINTIFYAAIVWALFTVPGAVRRRVRIRRGQCVRCAYLLGASGVCSECGTPTQKGFKP